MWNTSPKYFLLFSGLGRVSSAALSHTLMAHGHIWLSRAHTAVPSTPWGFMAPPLLGNCTAYWQLALMKQQEFPEGNALLTRIITISSCGASGSGKRNPSTCQHVQQDCKSCTLLPVPNYWKPCQHATRHRHLEASWQHLLRMLKFLQLCCMGFGATGNHNPYLSVECDHSYSSIPSAAYIYLEREDIPTEMRGI